MVSHSCLSLSLNFDWIVVLFKRTVLASQEDKTWLNQRKYCREAHSFYIVNRNRSLSKLLTPNNDFNFSPLYFIYYSLI